MAKMLDLTKGDERKTIVKYAVPLIVGSVLQNLYSLINSVIVGNYLGKEALAAVGISFPIIFAVTSLIIGFTIGLSIVIGQYFGSKQYDNLKKSISTSYISLVVFAIIMTTFSILTGKYLLKLLGAQEDIIAQATSYFNVFCLGFLFAFPFNATNAVLRGIGDSITPVYFLVFSIVVNFVLNYVFVVVLNYGLTSTAWASVIGQILALILMIVYINKKHPFISIKLKEMKFDSKIFKYIMKISLPSGIQQFVIAINAVVLMSLVASFGTDAIAGYSVATRIDAIASIPAFIFSSALANFVAQNAGALEFKRIKNGLKATLRITVSMTIIISVLIIIFSKTIMSLFTKDIAVIEIGSEYLRTLNYFYVLYAMMFAYQSVFRGSGDTMISMLITLAAIWIVRIPFSYMLSKHLGTLGIWLGIPIGWFVGLILSYSYYKSRRWELKFVMQMRTRHTPPPEIADNI
ncbi:MAG: MATE family efflux transporter [Bacteroidales bacterium]|jgi:putative MATE family efflux protein|nr:MATE family efflux transporter [Bacteroidales bacterium]MDI9575105.1 MATE family efflux transporter [Bacteroidota bacterium]MDD2592795.1 MATE family efflux transporter [Bacteroidales bacterium]MDD3755238.1 MATE family efflux transporter [Bacteroidales bacterium]MDY0400463.1 MATE family efflux transporter [Bacteroidales bacterium]